VMCVRTTGSRVLVHDEPKLDHLFCIQGVA